MIKITILKYPNVFSQITSYGKCSGCYGCRPGYQPKAYYKTYYFAIKFRDKFDVKVFRKSERDGILEL